MIDVSHIKNWNIIKFQCVGQNDIYEINKVAASNGYYVLDYPEINEPQVFDLLNKKIFVRLKNYYVPYPIEYFTLESFVYRNIDTKFSSVVSDTTRLLLKILLPDVCLWAVW